MKCDRLKGEEIKACHYLHCQQKKVCMHTSFINRPPPFKRASKLEPSLFKGVKGGKSKKR